jgi:molybdopterin converting factor subunit 1
MILTVLVFASAREIIGESSIEIRVDAGFTSRNLLDHLCEIYPNLADSKDQLSIAVNRNYCIEEVVLKEGDEVALLPPISGG